MSRIAFHRPARITMPSLPNERLELPAPPTRPEKQGGAATWMTLLLPLLTSASIAAYMITVGRPLLVLIGIGFVLVSVGAVVAMRAAMSGVQRKGVLRQRLRYRSHLAVARDNARVLARLQREIAVWTHPSPDRLWAITTTLRRVWERRPGDADFLMVRLGLGQAPLAVPLQLGNGRLDPMTDYDTEAMGDAQHTVQRFGTVSRQPALVDVNHAGVISLVGRPETTRALARALLCQVAVLHSPDDVLIVARTAEASDWTWLKWLPHTFEPEATGDAGVVPLVADELDGIADFLEGELARRRERLASRRTALSREAPTEQRLLVLFDGYDPATDWARSPVVKTLFDFAGPELGVTVLCLAERDNQQPTRVDVQARLENGQVVLEGDSRLIPERVTEIAPDLPAVELAELIARMLAPLSLSEEREHVLARTVSLRSMLGWDLDSADITTGWVGANDERMLRLPVGIDGDGQPVELDLKESALGGMGPHGLVVGATGSGKSEMLRTLVTGLALTHPPELLSFVLIDFKGGATFAQHTELPHVAGVITNLADDLALVDRVQAALRGEQQRREQLLKDAGNIDSVRSYQLLQAAGRTDVHGRPLQPLPYLLVIVDEFGELLSARPDFIDLFVQIGRVGRSLGIHLLLATQRLEEGRLRGLESHLSYRVCLRTFTAPESRTVIGTTDAYRLPSIPGSAYLKVDESVYVRFRVAHISEPHITAEQRAAEAAAGPPEITEYGLRQAPDPDEDDNQRKKATAVLTGPTEMQVAIERIKWVGQPVHQVWLPPLPRAIPLDMLVGAATGQTHRGLRVSGWPYCGQLKFPVGVIDLPIRQEQKPLVLDFAGGHGHLAIVGAPQTGRSTLLRTTMLSAMLTNSPAEAQFYCVDFGGGTLPAFVRSPHTGGVAGRSDIPLVRRLLADVHELIGTREKLFHELGTDSIAGFRGLRDAGRLPADIRAADVFLVIDNWGAVRAEVEAADAYVLDIASRGLGVGVHLLLTANRWADIRPNLRDAVDVRLELRLGEPTESELSRSIAKGLPAGVPGRGVAAPGVYFQAALPRIDSQDNVADLREAQADVVDKIAAAWNEPPAPPVRLLPERVTVAEIAPGRDLVAPAGALIGLDEATLSPVWLDLTADDPHLLVFGDVGAGKTALLQTLGRELAARSESDDLRLVVIDFRRSLLEAVPEEFLAGYACDPEAARVLVQKVVNTMSQRMPPSDISPRQLRSRSWWEGPEIYLLADDYDLAGTGAASPLAPLAAYLPQARELGLHVVISRRTSGASRALIADQVLTRIRDLGTYGILLSGDPREGALIGDQRAMRLPPGRGIFVRRNKPPALIQIAVSEDTDEDTASGLPAAPPAQALSWDPDSRSTEIEQIGYMP